MAIENCGLPCGPRTIAVSWDSYILVGLLAELRADDARVKCISFKVSSVQRWLREVHACRHVEWLLASVVFHIC